MIRIALYDAATLRVMIRRAAKGDTMSAYSDVERAVDEAATYWIARKWAFLNQANEEFMTFVDPAVCYKDCLQENDVAMVNMCFSEWALFERPLRRGLTPLEVFVDTPPVGTDARTVDLLRQVIATQFFSRFAILDKDTQSHIAVLRDVRTDRRYDVFTPRVCNNERWHRGSIAMRIACADGAWQAVGQVYLYDVAPVQSDAVDGPGEMHPEDYLIKPEAEFMGFYMRMLRDTFGIEGRYHESARLREVAA